MLGDVGERGCVVWQIKLRYRVGARRWRDEIFYRAERYVRIVVCVLSLKVRRRELSFLCLRRCEGESTAVLLCSRVVLLKGKRRVEESGRFLVKDCNQNGLEVAVFIWKFMAVTEVGRKICTEK